MTKGEELWISTVMTGVQHSSPGVLEALVATADEVLAPESCAKFKHWFSMFQRPKELDVFAAGVRAQAATMGVLVSDDEISQMYVVSTLTKEA